MAPKLLLAIILLISATSILSSSAFHNTGALEGPTSFVFPESLNEAKEDHNKACSAFGIMGDCGDDDNPMNAFLDNTTAKRSRLLWDSNRYISYTAMRRNSIPCSQRGSSYYNCRPGQAVNPYHRGCSAITRCARVW